MSSTTTHLEPAGTVAYHEPSLPQLLTLISFLYFLQVARNIANYTLGAGLLGECAIGIIYGPVAKILVEEWQETFVALGYIGLILIVFEGGLDLNVRQFLPLLPLALVSALVGILLPLAFTFALFSSPSFNYPPIEAFTVGSALASTSLGTTFFVLKSAGNRLDTTKIAQVLKGAALIDDIIALVLLSVVSSLASDGTSTSLGWTIGRPIVASVAMCLVTPFVILYVLRPIYRSKFVDKVVKRAGQNGDLFLGVAVLSAFLAIAYYAGTTVLLGSFLAGLTLPLLPLESSSSSHSTFLTTYTNLLTPIQNYILIPLFFASIGFSIPFLQLWEGKIVWRGVCFSLLMVVGKVLVGVCIVGFDLLSRLRSSSSSSSSSEREDTEGGQEGLAKWKDGRSKSTRDNTFAERSIPPPSTTTSTSTVIPSETSLPTTIANDSATSPSLSTSFNGETLPAAAFLGFALVARGEIGILVLQVAYNASSTSSNPVLTTEPYLVAIWAVAVCTIVGPVGFAQLVKSRWGKKVLRGKWGN